MKCLDIKERRFELLAVGLFSFVIGFLCLFKIFEIDIFEYLRMGRELLQFHDISIDRWTFTIRGTPWHPNHWLAYAVFAAVDKIGSYSALVILRSLLIALWIGGLAFTVVQVRSRSYLNVLHVFLWPLWILISCQWKIYLRPDLISSILLVGLMVLWMSRLPASRKIVLSLATLFLWAYVHSGTFIIGFLFFAGAVFLEPLNLKKRLVFIGAGLLCWFLTPDGFGVVGAFLQNTIFYKQRALLMANPDNAPFDPASLLFKNGGWSYILWLVYTVLASLLLLWAAVFKKFSLLPGPYKNWWFVVPLWIFLIFGVFTNARTILFQTAFILPVVAFGTSHILGDLSRASEKARFGLIAGWIFIGSFLIFRIIPDNYRLSGLEWGLGVNKSFVPIRGVEFLKENIPPTRVLNFIDWGALFLSDLPNFQIAMDTRDLPFVGFLAELKTTKDTPSSYSNFLKKYSVDVVMDDLVNLKRNLQLYPESEWGTVYFDNTSIIYLRRIPEYSSVINKYEYKVLRRDMKPEELVEEHKANLQALNEEVQRCFKNVPENAYCNFVEARILEEESNFGAALEYVRKSESSQSRNPRIFAEEIRLLTRLGKTDEIKPLQRWLEKLQ